MQTGTKLYKTLKQRIKDKHVKTLLKLAREVNFVFNYVNNLSYEHTRRKGQFLSAFDIAHYTKGCTDNDFGDDKIHLHSQTVQAIAEEYVLRRKQFRKSKLNWRVSNKESSKYSLGWIPFKASGIKIENGQIRYGGQWFSIWDSYDITKYKNDIKSGSFVEDARGRWYICLVVEVQPQAMVKVEDIKKEKSIGIDLGLKDFATITNGQNHTKVEAAKNYRKLEEKLAKAQRARKPDLVRAIHAKIKNTRKDEHHKLSTQLVRQNQAIFVGDVSSTKLVKTKMAKSVLDAGWSMFRDMLKYKCNHAGIYYLDVDERYTTQICNACGAHTGPKGRAELGIREWGCSCGAIHDRDVNSALNILVRGHAQLAGGIPVL